MWCCRIVIRLYPVSSPVPICPETGNRFFLSTLIYLGANLVTASRFYLSTSTSPSGYIRYETKSHSYKRQETSSISISPAPSGYIRGSRTVPVFQETGNRFYLSISTAPSGNIRYQAPDISGVKSSPYIPGHSDQILSI